VGPGVHPLEACGAACRPRRPGPTAEGWFISFCLNIEIAFRGWAGISFALWVRKQKALGVTK